MTTAIRAPGFPADEVRARAREGAARAFPECADYGAAMVGASGTWHEDALDALRLAPPIFTPSRLEKLVELGREPVYTDVVTETGIGGFRAPLPLFVCALGSTDIAGNDLGEAISAQAGRLGLPMVIGENLVPIRGYGRIDGDQAQSLLSRIRRYREHLPDGFGGVAVQQSTEDADAEVWNHVYSDPAATDLLESGRLAFELKVGQGAKPGLGGMTVVDGAAAAGLADRFALDPVFGAAGGVLRNASPGTFTREILRQQIRLMRNNFPRARVWVKLHPGRDVREAADVAWAAGADAVTVDGAEGGSGWAPRAFLEHVGLSLHDCLRELRPDLRCLLVSGRMWDGARVVKSLALGAHAAGLGRAAFLAADEDREHGLIRLVECIGMELRLLVSALGKYRCLDLTPCDLWPTPVADTPEEI